MNPSCKLSKMLQIPLERQLPAPKCYKFHKNLANSMENERFQLQNVAKIVEMAASSSKMLQIARKSGRKTDPKKQNKTGKHNSQNNSGPLIFSAFNKSHCWPHSRIWFLLCSFFWLNFEWFLDVLRGMGVFRADTTVHFHCQRAKSTNPKGTLSPCRIYIIVYLDMNIYIYM